MRALCRLVQVQRFRRIFAARAGIGFLLAAHDASVACGGFGFAHDIAVTFDVFSGLEVTNYGLSNILFESAPNGSHDVDVWLLCVHAQTAFLQFVSWQRFSHEPW